MALTRSSCCLVDVAADSHNEQNKKEETTSVNLLCVVLPRTRPPPCNQPTDLRATSKERDSRHQPVSHTDATREEKTPTEKETLFARAEKTPLQRSNS